MFDITTSVILYTVIKQSVIGFTAWAEAQIDFHVPYGKIDSAYGNRLKFTGVLVNEGEFYSTETGEFSCDVSGVYYVAVTLKRTDDSKDHFTIAVYKVKKRILTCDSPKHNPGMSVTNSRLVECRHGEYLAMGYWSSGLVYGEPGVPHSIFTAILMHKTGLLKSCLNKYD